MAQIRSTNRVTKRAIIFSLYISWASNLHTVFDKTYFDLIWGIERYREMERMEVREHYIIGNLF